MFEKDNIPTHQKNGGLLYVMAIDCYVALKVFLCDRWIKNVKNSFISSDCEDATQTA